MSTPPDDLQPLRAAYARRDADAALAARYDPLRPEVLRARQQLECAVAAGLRARGLQPAALDALEVGCGTGDPLLMLLRLGLDPARLQGAELLPERLAAARHRLPAALRLHAGDAAALPLPAASLDLVAQFTVFSSLTDPAQQQRLAAALWRWLRPGGCVLWYDFTVDNPRNPDVRGVPLSRLRQLFPQGQVRSRRLTLAPPLARAAARVHPALLPLLDVPPLRTHVLAWVAKPLETAEARD